jgi:hypothetical protein
VYASFGEKVPPTVRNAIGTSKVTITVSLGGEGLMCVDTLDPDKRFAQNRFISLVLSDLKKRAQAKTPDQTGCAHGQFAEQQRIESR